jgi:hypothetical protein
MLNPTGSEAHLLLNSFPDDRLIVEIGYQRSIGPPAPSVLTTLWNRINETCSKASVTFEEFPFTSTQSSFSDSDLLSLDSSVRHTWPSWGTMSLFYLYLDGGYSALSGVLGIAYRSSSIAIFERTIVSSSTFGEATAVTTTVMIHEFGHELGLVGIVGNAPNQDPNHPYHSNDPNDVMYWAVDTQALFGIGPSPPTQFGSADLSDLNSARLAPIITELLPWIVLVGSVLAALVILVRGFRGAQRKRSSTGP